jgi:hypothetical protein
MKIDKQKLIDAGAVAIRNVDLYGDFDPHEYIEGSTKLAEAALTAIVRELPELGNIHHEGLYALVLYKQLKEMGK